MSKLGEFVSFSNGRTSPARISGASIPVMGSNGCIGFVETANVDRPCTIIGRVGSYCGSTHYVKQPCWVTDNAIAAVSKDVNAARFWHSFLTNYGLNSLAHGSGQPLLTQAVLRDIDVPDFADNRKYAIADVLGALDDKIAANQKVIGLADDILLSLYKQQPKRVSVKAFEDVTGVFGGGTPSTKNPDFWDGDIRWATPTDLTALNGLWLCDTSRKITDEGLANSSGSLHPTGSILMTSRATIGSVALVDAPTTTNQGFINLVPKEGYRYWLFAQLRTRTDDFLAWANGATFLELSRGTFKKLPFYECSESELIEFNKVAEPLMSRALVAQKENQTLARTRDELLPLLMNGKITVAEAEQEVGAVGVDKRAEGAGDV